MMISEAKCRLHKMQKIDSLVLRSRRGFIDIYQEADRLQVHCYCPLQAI